MVEKYKQRKTRTQGLCPSKSVYHKCFNTHKDNLKQRILSVDEKKWQTRYEKIVDRSICTAVWPVHMLYWNDVDLPCTSPCWCCGFSLLFVALFFCLSWLLSLFKQNRLCEKWMSFILYFDVHLYFSWRLNIQNPNLSVRSTIEISVDH